MRQTRGCWLLGALLLCCGCESLRSRSRPPLPGGGRIGLQLLGQGFTAPLALAPLPGGGFLVADQIGVVHLLDAEGKLSPDPFLDLRGKLVRLQPGYDERGLLGLALHPDFARNRRLFVYYSAPRRDLAPAGFNHTARLSEFLAAEPTRADPASERLLLAIDQPQANHNGGQITFGPDGMLYIPLGDGGGAGDSGPGHLPGGNGQALSTLLGKILRIDVDRGEPYSVPDDNPFLGDPAARPEIWAHGFRNPYRISFDSGGEHSLFAGDVGQNLWEEIDIVRGGDNHGWNIREGRHCFGSDPASSSQECPSTGSRGEALISPILEYPNAGQRDGLGTAVIGGFVYRGEALPSLRGRYVFGDFTRSFSRPDGSLFLGTPPAEGGEWGMQELAVGRPEGRLGEAILSLGQDARGELYVLTSSRLGPSGSTGRVYRLVPPGGKSRQAIESQRQPPRQ